MRVATAFNRMLGIDGATVSSVTFTGDGIVVGLRRRFRRLTCPWCGWSTRAGYDRSTRRWHHIDAGSSKIWLEAEIRRLECRRCSRVVTEQVPWARHDARHSRDLQDVIAWLAQRCDEPALRTHAHDRLGCMGQDLRCERQRLLRNDEVGGESPPAAEGQGFNRQRR